MDDLNYDELDPGIRETVRFVRSLGIETSDSGDGVTKLAAGWDAQDAMDFPHVWAFTKDFGTAVHRAGLLASLLRRMGMPVVENGMPGVTICVSFDPVTMTTILMIDGLNDEMLAKAKKPAWMSRLLGPEDDNA